MKLLVIMYALITAILFLSIFIFHLRAKKVRQEFAQLMKKQYEAMAQKEQIENFADFSALAQVKLLLINELLLDTIMILHKKNIPMKLCVNGLITKGGIKESDLYKVLVCLLDNAIEETEQQDQGYIHISLSKNSNYMEARIVNTLERNIDVSLAYMDGFTTKKGHAGHGLQKVRKITDKYPNIFLCTYRHSNLFIQTLRIEIVSSLL